ASTRTASVSTWTTQYMNPNAEEDGKVARAISERTDGVPLSVGSACICTASQETPTNIVIAITPRTVSVAAAFRPCGRRNTVAPGPGTAPTPAGPPPRGAPGRKAGRPAPAPAPATIGCGATACGQPLAAHLVSPTPIRTKIDDTKAYVGSANKTPASLTPRR